VDRRQVDVMVCTYSLFERDSGKADRSFLRRIQFFYMILDEAHSIKNSSSNKHDNLRQLRSQRRLLLSGTPVQNDIKELLALLAFLTPSVFRKADVQVLLTGLDLDDSRRLRGTANEILPVSKIREMLAPFVLRRLKSDVLNQLVPKTIRVEKLSMTARQLSAYERIIRTHAASRADRTAAPVVLANRRANHRSAIARELDDLLTDNSGAVSKKAESAAAPSTQLASEQNNIFTALRKVANHPLLLRVYYTDTVELDKIASVTLASGHFGDHCDYSKVRAEIDKMSDFEIHCLCLEHNSLKSLTLDSEVLFDSPKMVALRAMLPQLVVSVCDVCFVCLAV
jgi:SWI/SNF-related matrix-associated actin-dependent regulator 1 of chromatin subfamily A